MSESGGARRRARMWHLLRRSRLTPPEAIFGAGEPRDATKHLPWPAEMRSQFKTSRAVCLLSAATETFPVRKAVMRTRTERQRDIRMWGFHRGCLELDVCYSRRDGISFALFYLVIPRSLITVRAKEAVLRGTGRSCCNGNKRDLLGTGAVCRTKQGSNLHKVIFLYKAFTPWCFSFTRCCHFAQMQT